MSYAPDAQRIKRADVLRLLDTVQERLRDPARWSKDHIAECRRLREILEEMLSIAEDE